MSRLIILEGPDGSGKSTLARELERLGFRTIAVGKPPDRTSRFQTMQHHLLPLIEHGSKKATELYPVVFDRLHVSEWVYGDIMRGGSPMVEKDFDAIQEFIDDNNGQLVLCLPPYEVCYRNWMLRVELNKEYVMQVEKFKRIYDKYDGSAYWHKWMIWDYHTAKESNNYTVEEFAKYLKEKECASSRNRK
jgi:thymidylate kinase